VRVDRYLFVLLTQCAIIGSQCAPAFAEEFLDIRPVDSAQGGAGPLTPFSPDTAALAPVGPATSAEADAANLDGCKVIARIDDQIILACEVLWHVNKVIEDHMKKVQATPTPEEIAAVRQERMKREVAMLVDRKLLFNEFRRNVPAENLPRIEDNLREPFEEKKIPQLCKLLNVNSQTELEHELARLGSSLNDERRAFNEQIIAAEWIHSKVKINEEVSPDEMLEYYKAHLTDYDFPTQARWEELAVRKDRFKDPSEAYAALALLGNEVWQLGTAKPIKGVAFAEVAKAKSDGFTAKNGGAHDWTTKGALQCAAMDEALFTLQVGQMSQIVDSGPMFHIVRVLERKEAGRKTFPEVQADIREKLKEHRYQDEAEKYLTRLRSEARIWTLYTGNVSADALLGRAPGQTQQK
jgi:hypothetical protein